METIKNYLDNVFAGLPKTSQMADLKNNILSNMEDKYNELKSEGKSENEAIGIVISEFGNIDELINELGLKKETEESSEPIVTQEETNVYLNAKKTSGIQIGIGVILCILAPASLILINELISDGFFGTGLSGSVSGGLGLISLFVLIAAAVSLFIYSGMNFERYKYMEEGVQLPVSVRDYLQQRNDSFTPTYNLSVILGVGMLILSPITLFIASIFDNSSSYGVVLLLAVVAIAVFLFIYFGSIRESYTRLLKIGDYAVKEKKKEDKVIGAVASIVWPLAVAIFLFSGFMYHNWHINWIIFPITGILFGMFSAAYSIITDKNVK
jgi:uncharacterized membrane protein